MALQKKSFNDIITFSRSTEATRYNASGLIELVPANAPRFDYDPLTKMARGLLVEETRTNLLLRSEDFLNNWSNTGQFLAITPASSNGPRGANTMTKFARTDLAIRYTSQAVSNTAVGATVTASIYAKAAATGGFLSLRIQATYPNLIDAWFNLTTGECGFGLVGEMSGGSVSAENVGGGVWRCIATATPSKTAANHIMFTPADAPGKKVDTPPAVMSDVYVDAVQLETGAFATSYIPTTTTQVTRTADLVKVNTLSPWYNPSGGTLYTEFNPGSIGIGDTCVSAWFRGSAAANSIITIRKDGSMDYITGLTTSPDGVVQTRMTVVGKPIPPGALAKAAFSFMPGESALSVNGSAVLKGTIDLMPTPSTLYLGSTGNGQQFLNGHLRAIRYYPRRLTDAELQALTT